MHESLEQIVAEYISRFPEAQEKLQLLTTQLAAHEKLNDRKNFNGHIAGSGIVLSPDKAKVLLIYHKIFQRWMQPGGHWETDDELHPLETAQREVTEETGVKRLTYLPLDSEHPLVPLDLDSHFVKTGNRKNEPNHWHHDFRYVFLAHDERLTHQEEEVSAAAWFVFSAPETAHVQGMIAKLRHFAFIAD